MPNIPDAASYVAPLGQGFQIGTQWQAQRERSREALQEEALRQQQFGVTQQEQAIRNAQAAREAQDYIATQQAQKAYQDRVSELTAPPAGSEDEGEIPAAERGITPGRGMPMDQAQRQATAEMMGRLPASQWTKVAPVMADQARQAYYESMPKAREQVAEVTAEGRKTVAQIRADWEKQRTEEKIRADKAIEERDKAAADAQLVPMFHPDTKKFLGYVSKTKTGGVPHYLPPEKKESGNPIIDALGGAASAKPESGDIPPVPKSPADANVGQSYRLSDGRIGKWNGKTFTIGQ